MDVDLSGLNRELICIEYPGIVKNIGNMLETLGSLREISKTIDSQNRRLELRFRPKDPYCKAVLGDRHICNSLVVGIRGTIIRNKKTGQVVSQKFSVEILARVKTVYRFNCMCDFQYLPIIRNKEGNLENLVDQFLPSDISGNSLLQWMDKPVSLFLPPTVFARVDNPRVDTYMYRRKSADKDDGEQSNLVGSSRKERTMQGQYVTFNMPHVPDKPSEKFMQLVVMKGVQKDFEEVKKLFETRPVWSRLALSCTSKILQMNLKIVLPAVAYYILTGPFRATWVRFGYNPHKDPSSKIYQTLDYRLRVPARLSYLVKTKSKGMNYFPSNKTTHSMASCRTITKTEIVPASEVESGNSDDHIFHPDKLIPGRQIFYQYIDLHVPEIEQMFARLPKTDGNCDIRNGWLPPGFDNHCRDVISSHLVKLLTSMKEKEQGNQDYDGESDYNEDSSDDKEDWDDADQFDPEVEIDQDFEL